MSTIQPIAGELEPHPDVALVDRVRAGDVSAYDTLVRKYERQVFRIAQHITQNREDAEDVMQDAFLKAYEKLEQFQGNSKFYTWLVRIAVNESLMRLRKRRTGKMVSIDEDIETEEGSVPRDLADWAPDPEQNYGQAELAERFAATPDRLRAALAEKVEALAQNLFAQVGDNLSGGVLQAQSGALRDSIQMQISERDGGIGAEIFSDGSVAYAAIQEYGGKTAAHEILPDKSRVLAFVMNGKQMFARVIHHPGSQIPARPYLGAALDEQRDDIARGLTDAVRILCDDLGETA